MKLLKSCGFAFAVGDADKRAKDAADVICSHPGGHGAFREAAERLIELKDVVIDDIVRNAL